MNIQRHAMPIHVNRVDGSGPENMPRLTHLPGRKPTPADREELLRIWDALSADGRKMLLFSAVAIAKEEGLPEGDGPLIRTGEK